MALTEAMGPRDLLPGILSESLMPSRLACRASITSYNDVVSGGLSSLNVTHEAELAEWEQKDVANMCHSLHN